MTKEEIISIPYTRTELDADTAPVPGDSSSGEEVSRPPITPEHIALLKQKFLDSEIRNKPHLAEAASAISLVRVAISTTEERIRLGYLPILTGDAMLRAITMEYLYRNTDIDNQGYNEPVCCTPFYTDELRSMFPEAFEEWEAPEE